MNGGKSLLSQEVLSLSPSLTASIVAFREKFFLETRARSAACVTHPPDSRSSIRPPNISLSLSLGENRRRKSRGRRVLEGGRSWNVEWRGEKVCEKWEEWNWSGASRVKIKEYFVRYFFSSQLDYFRSAKGDGVKKLFVCWKIIINFEYYLISENS